MRLIDADYIVNVAERAHEQWSLAMVGADSTRKVNETFKKQYLCKVVKAIADDAPTIEAEPVRHGRWERTSDGAAYCTACKRKMNPSQYGYAFCGLCGAKMDGEQP